MACKASFNAARLSCFSYCVPPEKVTSSHRLASSGGSVACLRKCCGHSIIRNTKRTVESKVFSAHLRLREFIQGLKRFTGVQCAGTWQPANVTWSATAVFRRGLLGQCTGQNHSYQSKRVCRRPEMHMCDHNLSKRSLFAPCEEMPMKGQLLWSTIPSSAGGNSPGEPASGSTMTASLCAMRGDAIKGQLLWSTIPSSAGGNSLGEPASGSTMTVPPGSSLSLRRGGRSPSLRQVAFARSVIHALVLIRRTDGRP